MEPTTTGKKKYKVQEIYRVKSLSQVFADSEEEAIGMFENGEGDICTDFTDEEWIDWDPATLKEEV